MIVIRQEVWGEIQYDTAVHRFSYHHNLPIEAVPYPNSPLVLNIDLTMKCNMNCLHCVAKDFKLQEDLVVTSEMIDWINESPFMVVVITGGEPFLPECEPQLFNLLTKIRDKGLIIDTNGTLPPSQRVIDAILQTQTLVRVSWDSTRPADEIYFRHIIAKAAGGKQAKTKNEELNLECYHLRTKGIEVFTSKGIAVAVQSVLHKKNPISILSMPAILKALSVKQWYIQRFIPSHFANDEQKYDLSPRQRDKVIRQLVAACKREEIECIIKKDKRHNSVFLLVGDGKLYTQSQKPGQKLLLGNINTEIRYFDYVSLPDHMERYYP
jgi:MoaA/NifB/PqqE/SkfB family radical SAM enzyme